MKNCSFYNMILINKTPLVKYNGPRNGWRNIWLKDETYQISGAFKIRGVANYFKQNNPAVPVVTASTGNHGTAVAIMANQAKLPAYVFIPTHTAEKKKARLRYVDARIKEIDGSYDDCERYARDFARQNQYLFIHSFEEEEIIEGHAGIFGEIEDEQPGIPFLFLPVGGGGLFTAGMRYYSNSRTVTGVEYDDAPALFESVAAGKRVDITVNPGPVEGLSVSRIGVKVFEAYHQYLPKLQLVSLQELETATCLTWKFNNIKCEMAGAAALAAALAVPGENNDCVCIISGGNIEEELFYSLIKSNKQYHE